MNTSSNFAEEFYLQHNLEILLKHKVQLQAERNIVNLSEYYYPTNLKSLQHYADVITLNGKSIDIPRNENPIELKHLRAQIESNLNIEQASAFIKHMNSMPIENFILQHCISSIQYNDNR